MTFMPLPSGAILFPVMIGPELWRFETYTQWELTAPAQLRDSHYAAFQVIAIDGKGRICTCGRDMQRANRDRAFPVVVYRVDPDEPIK